MQKILILRFSAMGDVAMLVPVVNSLAQQHPEVEITILTRKHLTPLFDWTPANVRTMGIDLKAYDGISGLNRLYRELKTHKFDAVADIHDVLRTKYLRWRFRLAGTKTVSIDKGRNGKKRLIGNGMDSKPLTLMTTRYAKVFERLGVHVELLPETGFTTKGEDFTSLYTLYGEKPANAMWIGIAPFAAHPGKIYPLEKMRKVAEGLADKGCRIFLFGAGKEESEILKAWETDGRIVSTCGQLGGLHNEMLLMSMLDAMLAMDSANMHIASIVGIPVCSIWGATHPKAGFTPWRQNPDYFIQQTELRCRPCSIFGNKPCRFGDFRCMTLIEPDTIINKILQIINGEL